MELTKVLDGARFAQVGYVVRDLEKTKAAYAAILGCEEPQICTGGEYEVTKTRVFGRPAPEAECKMAFFNLPSGVQLELIEPMMRPRCGEITWIDTEREFIILHFLWTTRTRP